MKNKNIIEKIKSFKVFDLKAYNTLVKSFGINSVNETFDNLYNTADEKEKQKLICLYYPYFITKDLNDMNLSSDKCFLIIDKYGSENIENYFTELLLYSKNPSDLKKKYEFFYNIIDEDNLNVENYNSDIDVQYNDAFQLYLNDVGQYPLLTIDDEKRLFKSLDELKHKLSIISFNENNNIIFNNIAKILSSVENINDKKRLVRISRYLGNDDKEIVLKYIELWEKINGKKKDNIIVPDKNMIEKEINIVISSEKYDHELLENELDYALMYCKNRDYIYNCNLRLVIALAKKFKSFSFPIEDRVSEGNIGLMKAVEKFDYNKGYKFSTYATWWIRQSITRAMADQARIIRIPVHVSETVNRIFNVRRNFSLQYGREPSIEEISEILDMPVEKVDDVLKFSVDTVSYDVPVKDDSDINIKDFIPDAGPSTESVAFKSALKADIEKCLASLTPKEQEVIRLRYGLNNQPPMTLEDVGKIYGVTRERIRQIENKGIRKLKHVSRSKFLKDYIID